MRTCGVAGWAGNVHCSTSGLESIDGMAFVFVLVGHVWVILLFRTYIVPWGGFLLVGRLVQVLFMSCKLNAFKV